MSKRRSGSGLGDTGQGARAPRVSDVFSTDRHSGAAPSKKGASSRERDGEESGEIESPTGPRSAADSLALEVPSPDRVLFSVLELSRKVFVEQHDEEIVRGYVDVLRELFPGRQFAVRLVAPDTGELAVVYATGRLCTETRDTVSVSSAALCRHAIHIEHPGITISERYVPLFFAGAEGFDVPLVDGERFLGTVAIEYALGVAPPLADPPTIVPMVLQLAATLRNAQLFRESVYLRDYLGKLIENANAPIIVVGRTRAITVVNRAFLAVTGFTREMLVGRNFVRLLPSSERRRLLPVYIGALRGEPSSNVEISIPRATRGSVRLSVNVASILSSDGEVDGVIAICRDLTEVRDLESQVLQAEKLATLGQLAAGVVHELNNPLTSITVYAEHLLRKYERAGGDPKDLEQLGRILEAAQRILNFTRDLVSYARPSAEPPRETSLPAVLDQALVFCDHVLGEHGATVERRYSPDVPTVFAVRSQLHQVFINLITNACHAMPEGKGRLVLETHVDEQAGRVAVRVQDNGAGIAPANLERIFEPFYTTKGEGKGTGLGLSIVRNIVRQHRGDITVESTPGEGTTFTVTLLSKSESPG